MNKYSADFEAFMVKDDLEGVLRFLKVLPETDGNIKNKLAAINGRLSKLESDRTVGILSQSEYTKERNQIRYGIIQTTTDLESRLNRKEELDSKKREILSSIKRYSAGLVLICGLMFLGVKIYSYFSYVSSINIPFSFFYKPIDRESLQELYEETKADSTLGNDRFNNIIRHLYSISIGRENYIKFFEIDTTSTYYTDIIEQKEFNKRFDEFLEKARANDITYDNIYAELEYEKELKEEILYDSIQRKYQIIDNMCNEIQHEIDRKIRNSENIRRNVDVELFNVKLNKSSRRFEARKKVKNGTGLIVYSVNAMFYIKNINSGDTLSEIRVEVNQAEGIRTVYSESLDTYSYWNQPNIYNAIKNYRTSDFYFSNKLIQVNAAGENYNLWLDYIPDNLPYDGYYRRNENYKTPDELTGGCPYLRYDNKEKSRIRESIKYLIKDNLEEKGFVFNGLYSELSIY